MDFSLSIERLLLAYPRNFHVTVRSGKIRLNHRAKAAIFEATNGSCEARVSQSAPALLPKELVEKCLLECDFLVREKLAFREQQVAYNSELDEVKTEIFSIDDWNEFLSLVDPGTLGFGNERVHVGLGTEWGHFEPPYVLFPHRTNGETKSSRIYSIGGSLRTTAAVEDEELLCDLVARARISVEEMIARTNDAVAAALQSQFPIPRDLLRDLLQAVAGDGLNFDAVTDAVTLAASDQRESLRQFASLNAARGIRRPKKDLHVFALEDHLTPACLASFDWNASEHEAQSSITPITSRFASKPVEVSPKRVTGKTLKNIGAGLIDGTLVRVVDGSDSYNLVAVPSSKRSCLTQWRSKLRLPLKAVSLLSLNHNRHLTRKTRQYKHMGHVASPLSPLRKLQVVGFLVYARARRQAA